MTAFYIISINCLQLPYIIYQLPTIALHHIPTACNCLTSYTNCLQLPYIIYQLPTIALHHITAYHCRTSLNNGLSHVTTSGLHDNSRSFIQKKGCDTINNNKILNVIGHLKWQNRLDMIWRLNLQNRLKTIGHLKQNVPPLLPRLAQSAFQLIVSRQLSVSLH